MLAHSSSAPTSAYLKDLVPSVTVLPPAYMVELKEAGEILSSPKRLKHKLLTFYSQVADFENNTITSTPQEFVSFPYLFGENSTLGKVFFPKKYLDQLTNSYLESLEVFLDDLHNEDNLLGAGFSETCLLVHKVKADSPFKTKLGHLDGPNDGIVIWIC